MIELSVRDLYGQLFSVFDLDPISSELLSRVVAGSEKSEDFENILRRDKLYTTVVCTQASEQMKTSVVSTLSHGAALLGLQNIRNMVLGHTLERLFKKDADSQFVNMGEAQGKLKFAILAEEHAKKCKNEYSGMAYAAGFMFDIFNYWIKEKKLLPEVMEPYFAMTWRHGLNAATLAWALATHERILISHRKIIFAAGLLHDIGKLGLAVYDPATYATVIEKMKAGQGININDDIYEVALEREAFDLTHPEIGSAIVFQTKFLKDLETEVDFHHDSIVLKTRNSDGFLGSAVINIADRLAWLMERKPSFVIEDVQEILKPHAAHFPLKSHEVVTLFAETRSRGLLTTA